ncbi:SDR family oxidoreductase [Nocardia sp. XZ_19_385]|uniref:SDR family oxidoreductase n=1 Tax=Nocardia sp. XZ_19_385 TaxID=2769488 RepID=UPI0018901199|nr:SDR family oxidoreductase [Nocardia sp. XZ_19_385]
MATLLTGGTGFMGSRLLARLMEDPQRDVIVLGRGSAAEVRERVLAALEGSQINGRLRFVTGDITRPWLGMTPAMHGRLLGETTELWHCAGDIALMGRRERLIRTNVLGTRNVLEFAGQTVHPCRLVYGSSVSVAGARPDGLVSEDDLDDRYGFKSAYDESKYQAELLVREWGARPGRSTVVFRPSVLITDETLAAQAPRHPALIFGEVIDDLQLGGTPGIATTLMPAAHRDITVRVPMSANSCVNFVQIEYAVEAMVRTAAEPEPGLRAFHVVHPVNTPLRTVLDIIENRRPGMVIKCVDHVMDPTPEERLVTNTLDGYLRFSQYSRSYDRTALLTRIGDLADPQPIDAAYLARAMGFDRDHTTAPQQ